MPVIFYARPGQLDTVIPRLLELSRRAEAHLVLETAPEDAGSSVFGPVPNTVPAGAHRDAWRSLAGWLPVSLEAELARVRLHRVVHDCPRAFHPRSVGVAVQAATLIRGLSPRVVHFDDSWTRAALVLCLLGKLPMVIGVHDMETHPGEGRSRIQFVRRVAWRRISHIIFYSQHCQRIFGQLRHFPRVPSTVVPFGVVDLFRAWEREALPTEPRSVLFFGRLSAYKGLPVLLAAAPLVARSVADTRFIIAGSPAAGFSMPALQALDNGGEYDVLAHYIPNGLTCDLFNRATLVVLPYTSATQSGVVMTAYGFGKPVVATRVGGLPEVVDDGLTGALVPPNDPQALAHAITRLLMDGPARARMQATIRSRALDEYSWERHATTLLRIYDSISRPRRRGGWRLSGESMAG